MSRVVSTLVVLAALLGPASARADKTSHGAALPLESREVGKDRFQTGGWADTLKFYWKTYNETRYSWKTIADQPGIRAIHITNTGHGAWEGLNIYEYNGVTRIFVLVKEPASKPRRSQ